MRVLYWDKAFNFSKINNFGASNAKGEYLICLNNDVEVIAPDWIEEMLGHCREKKSGLSERGCIIRTIRSSMRES